MSHRPLWLFTSLLIKKKMTKKTAQWVDEPLNHFKTKENIKTTPPPTFFFLNSLITGICLNWTLQSSWKKQALVITAFKWVLYTRELSSTVWARIDEIMSAFPLKMPLYSVGYESLIKIHSRLKFCIIWQYYLGQIRQAGDLQGSLYKSTYIYKLKALAIVYNCILIQL